MTDKIIYVSGYNLKLTTQHQLEELFTQAGPIRHVKMFESRAQVCFQDPESVPYCLALFQGLELHGERLRFQTMLTRKKDSYVLVDYLAKVREVIRQEFMNLPRPNLPAKKYSTVDYAKGEKRKWTSNEKKAKKPRRNYNQEKTTSDIGRHSNTSKRKQKIVQQPASRESKNIKSKSRTREDKRRIRGKRSNHRVKNSRN